MRKTGWILGIAVIGACLGWLLFGEIEENIVYFVTPTELLEKGEAAYDQPLRLGGMVQPASVTVTAEPFRLEFRLTDGKKEIPVVSTETPPQMFQDGIGVVVEGKLGQDGVFETKRLMVKHSNEYHPPKEGEKPKILYKDLLGSS